MAALEAVTNLDYGNPDRLWAVFVRKLGLKPRSRRWGNPTLLYNAAADAGTTFPRQIGFCAKYSATAPTTNAAGDAPTGKGDICIQFKANTGVTNEYTVDVAQIDVFRCTVYTSNSVFTWAQIL